MGGLLKAMRLGDYITISPDVRSGKPCIKGTPITVSDVLEYLAGGMTEAQILAGRLRQLSFLHGAPPKVI
jgi:uncharacterized protein (DUF433 family)